MKLEIRPSQEDDFILESEILLPKPIDEVFAFFSDAKNLEILTPPFLKFQVLEPEKISMQKGTLINYKLKLWGVPFSWTSEISTWTPPNSFTDEQLKGPYRYWIHEHKFEAQGESTLVKDYVRYSVYGGILIELLFVRPSLKKIFQFRADKMFQLFGTNK